ncbi:cytochrome P450 [Nocardia gipuzkoensis]
MPEVTPKPFPTSRCPSLSLDPLLEPEDGRTDPILVVLPHGDPCWLIRSHLDVRRVMGGDEFDRSTIDTQTIPRVGSGSMLIPGTIFCMSGPDHHRLRKLLTPHLNASYATKLHGRIEEIARGITAGLVEADRPVDLVAEYCNPLTMRVFCEVLGVRPDDGSDLARWSATLLSRSADKAARMDAGVSIANYLMTRIELEEYSAESILHSIVEGMRDGRANVGEGISLSVSVVLAGFETTSHMMAKFLYRIMRDERVRAAITAEGTDMPRAIDELLRITNFAGGEMLPYRAKVDCEFGSVTIRAGDYVLPAIGGANMDPRVFTSPSDMDLERHPNPHLTFGFGTHYCAGAPLARSELSIGVDSFLRSPLRDYRLRDPEPAWEWDSIVWPIKSLVIEPSTRVE